MQWCWDEQKMISVRAEHKKELDVERAKVAKLESERDSAQTREENTVGLANSDIRAISEELAAERAKAETLIKGLLIAEWLYHGGGTRTCLGCGGWRFPAEGHREACAIDAALTLAGYPDHVSRDTKRFEMRKGP
jgi:hypothetical protein